MTNSCRRPAMRWNEVTGAIARHKRASTQCGRLNTFASVSPWTCSGISRRPIAHRPRRPCIRPVLGRKNSKNDATVSGIKGFVIRRQTEARPAEAQEEECLRDHHHAQHHGYRDEATNVPGRRPPGPADGIGGDGDLREVRHEYEQQHGKGGDDEFAVRRERRPLAPGHALVEWRRGPTAAGGYYAGRRRWRRRARKSSTWLRGCRWEMDLGTVGSDHLA